MGGGSNPDATIHCLAHIPLRWMVQEVIKSQCGILFNELALERAVIHIPPVGEPSENGPAPVDCDSVDALQPLDDELKKQPLWWILELLPLSYVYQDEKCVWHRRYRSVQFVD